jgi:hypothetical protein
MANTSGEQLLKLAQQTGALVITLLVLGYCSVLLRLWVRLRITKNTSWDDATMVLSLVSQVTQTGIQRLTVDSVYSHAIRLSYLSLFTGAQSTTLQPKNRSGGSFLYDCYCVNVLKL